MAESMIERVAKAVMIRAWCVNRRLHRRYDAIDETRPVLRFGIAMAVMSPLFCLPQAGRHPLIVIALALYGLVICLSRLCHLTVRLKPHGVILSESPTPGDGR